MNASVSDEPVIIVGAGISGLTCAVELVEAGRQVRVLEASDAVGGRMRTDRHDGFLLDRGFQVFLTGYPYAMKRLNLQASAWHAFEAGSLIRWQGGFARFSDPWRRPGRLFETLLGGPGNLMDRFRIGRLRTMSRRATHEQVQTTPETETTGQLFDRLGFSHQFREAFLDPWWRGVLLDRELTAPASYLRFIFRAFSDGEAVLPAHGIQQLPEHMASQLPEGMIEPNTAVAEVTPDHVTLSTGERIRGAAIVLATDLSSAYRCLGAETPPLRGTRCIYFAADRAPVPEAMLVLNSDPEGSFNHLCVLSNVCPGYAPAGRALVSVTAIDPLEQPDGLETAVVRELRDWFGPEVEGWQHLRTYHVPEALPVIGSRKPKVPEGLIVAGDWTATGSIEGAMLSGKRAAEAVLARQV
ncbi:NAD(P)/FAD-dependent oxidoreductase [Mucisphaera sp.]|uniref:NAD(P)/FAD-dependent oxidoreductase n=1 Tax=Mucisphaera sp. TaxID=2913024 RepID=UPI003D0E5E9D